MFKKLEQPLVIKIEDLPENFPTHKMSSEFAEALGRAVSTFAFLEGALVKAIAVLDHAGLDLGVGKVTSNFDTQRKLEKLAADTLRNLITEYRASLSKLPPSCYSEPDDLFDHLSRAIEIRNILCHGAWGATNGENGYAPHFVRRDFKSRDLLKFDGVVDLVFLRRVQAATTELIAHVIGSVTGRGWVFPGSGL